MSPEIFICDRKIGFSHPPITIVEIGINHEGKLETAFEMVDAAIAAGAEIIKHQTHVVEDEMIPAAKEKYQAMQTSLSTILWRDAHYLKKMRLN
jgi:sialic acid synthase SpsE